MILYDSKREFKSIDEQTLEILGFDSINDFLSYTDDFANLFKKEIGLIYNFQFLSWIDYTLNVKNSVKKAILETPHKKIQTEINISKLQNGSFTIYLENIEVIYSDSNNTLKQKEKTSKIEEAEDEPEALNLENIIKQDTFSSDDLDELLRDFEDDKEIEKVEEKTQNDLEINHEIDTEIKNELDNLLFELEEQKDEPENLELDKTQNIKNLTLANFNLETHLLENNLELSEFKNAIEEAQSEFNENFEILDFLIKNRDINTIQQVAKLFKTQSEKYNLTELNIILDNFLLFNESNFDEKLFREELDNFQKIIDTLLLFIENYEEKIKLESAENDKSDILEDLKFQLEEFENHQKLLQQVDLNKSLLKQINNSNIEQEIFEDMVKDFIFKFEELRPEIDFVIESEDLETLKTLILELKHTSESLEIDKISKIINFIEDDIFAEDEVFELNEIETYTHKKLNFDEIDLAFLELNNYLNSLKN
jgi:hypothetical protein